MILICIFVKAGLATGELERVIIYDECYFIQDDKVKAKDGGLDKIWFGPGIMPEHLEFSVGDFRSIDSKYEVRKDDLLIAIKDMQNSFSKKYIAVQNWLNPDNRVEFLYFSEGGMTVDISSITNWNDITAEHLMGFVC